MTNTTVRPVEHVLVEPLAEDAELLRPFEGVLRHHADGRLTLAGPGERWLPRMATGTRVLVVYGGDRDAADAPVLRVVEADPDAAGAVLVAFEGVSVRRPARIDERVPVDGVSITLRHPAGTADGNLHDVSLRGVRITHAGAPLAIGLEVSLVGALEALDGERHRWELRYEVAWSGVAGPDRAVAGMRCRDGQRLAAARLTRWALRAGRDTR